MFVFCCCFSSFVKRDQWQHTFANAQTHQKERHFRWWKEHKQGPIFPLVFWQNCLPHSRTFSHQRHLCYIYTQFIIYEHQFNCKLERNGELEETHNRVEQKNENPQKRSTTALKNVCGSTDGHRNSTHTHTCAPTYPHTPNSRAV